MYGLCRRMDICGSLLKHVTCLFFGCMSCKWVCMYVCMYVCTEQDVGCDEDGSVDDGFVM